jgi:hypothetical protein
MMTCMACHQLYTNDPNKKPWMYVVERFNDPVNLYENMFPDDYNRGEDNINSANLL